MTEVGDEASLIAKRKSDLVCECEDDTQGKTDDSIKKQKLDISSTEKDKPLISKAEENKDANGTETNNALGDGNKIVEEDEDHKAENALESQGDDEDDEDEEEYEFDDSDESDDDDDEDNDDEDDDHSNGNGETVDRKGKGIMIDEKGKGKMIEDSDEDSIKGGSASDGDSDLSDDPFAEVDLDNILPTRTRSRGRAIQRGVHILDNQGPK